jgi:hypothetical protein
MTGALQGIERIYLQACLLCDGLDQHAADRQTVFDNQYFMFHPAP